MEARRGRVRGRRRKRDEHSGISALPSEEEEEEEAEEKGERGVEGLRGLEASEDSISISASSSSSSFSSSLSPSSSSSPCTSPVTVINEKAPIVQFNPPTLAKVCIEKIARNPEACLLHHDLNDLGETSIAEILVAVFLKGNLTVPLVNHVEARAKACGHDQIVNFCAGLDKSAAEFGRPVRHSHFFV